MSSLNKASFEEERTSTGKPHQKHVVSARKLSGLEEAARIRRLRELKNANKIRKRPPLRQGKVSGRLPVPDHIPKPPYVSSSVLPELSSDPQIPDSEGITGMRAACELAARVLDFAGTLVRPSVTTNEIDKAVHQMIIDAGAYPSPLGYGGFPKSDGDIINIDVTVYLNGYHGDTSKTFLCGEVHESVKLLVKSPFVGTSTLYPFLIVEQVTEECLDRAISVCKDGASFKKIGKKISEHAEKYGYGIVERFVGHGVGKIFHSEPIIMHHRNDRSGCMVEGQTFTIEPILTMGSIECITWDDGWTTVTADGSPAAQFEHTLLITRTGAEGNLCSFGSTPLSPGLLPRNTIKVHESQPEGSLIDLLANSKQVDTS
ncbi:hypothetical protein QJS04_geneDACA003089 [Acorus gramineus]|uniref:Peptidase M24 domain-containing protein n=1 Tax=Acorus gramineus TaxID=55184 RepID=A0AAV9BS55_ACOGR|nr:hypothetical protein QJS04_geneDACA003089 [Acorus gramineus]